MAYFDVSRITSWHAHVYFDAASRDAAKEFREVVTTQSATGVLEKHGERPLFLQRATTPSGNREDSNIARVPHRQSENVQL